MNSTIFENLPTFQTKTYAKLQEANNNRVYKILIEKEGRTVGYMQLILYPLFGQNTFLYAPRGPYLEYINENILLKIKKQITLLAEKHNVAFVRIDPHIKEEVDKSLFINNGFIEVKGKKAYGSVMQPQKEWILDINLPQEELLKNMHKKTRYSINYAEKRQAEFNIEIYSTNLVSQFDRFYTQLEHTAERKHINLHSKKYYKTALKVLDEEKAGFVVIGSHNGEDVIANLFWRNKDEVLFMFGGSTPSKTVNYLAQYAMWRGILYAKEGGAKTFNFGGVLIDRGSKNTQTVDAFKMHFGGQVREHNLRYDYPIKKGLYNLYSLYKAIL